VVTPLAVLPALKRALAGLIAEDDEVVVVFSGLWSFGHRLGVSPPDVPAAVLDVLLEAVGDRTLVLPAYTNAFPRTKVFDLRRSQPETGVLPKYALTNGQFHRTANPMDSYLTFGLKSNEILHRKETTLWGDDSVMAWFGQVNARILVLGEPWHRACAFYHRAEELIRVPYRYYKRFNGSLVDIDDSRRPCSTVMYVRPLQQPIVWDHTKIQPILMHKKVIAVSGDPDIPVQSARAGDVLDACLELLTEDPYAYVVNSDDLKNWIVNGGMRREIDDLPYEQRVQND
jgi:aminoglycoside 3-N-acetyltransferase